METVLTVFITLLGSGQVVFKSDTSLVNILATVHDDQGRVVRGLTQEDFRLEEDGQPREIHDFAAQSDLPLTLALLVDTSGSMIPVLDYQERASVIFLNEALRPGKDQATVFQFDSEVKMLCGLEAPGKALDRAVHGIKPTPSNGTVSSAPHRTTALYDAIVEASRQLQPVAGRKAIILLTDGLDVRSNHSLNEAVEAALHSDTAVYAILVPSPILAAF